MVLHNFCDRLHEPHLSYCKSYKSYHFLVVEKAVYSPVLHNESCQKDRFSNVVAEICELY